MTISYSLDNIMLPWLRTLPFADIETMDVYVDGEKMEAFVSQPFSLMLCALTLPSIKYAHCRENSLMMEVRLTSPSAATVPSSEL